MACRCSTMTPFQRLSLAWNEVMNVRADLNRTDFDATTKILADMDALLFRLQPQAGNDPVPLYTSLCEDGEGLNE